MRSSGQTRADLMALRALISNGVSTVTGKIDALESSLSPVATSGSYDDLTDTPTLSAVATSGAYSDLTGKPTLGDLAALDSITTAKISNWSSATSGFLTASSLTPYAKTADLAAVATSGNYSDLSGVPDLSGYATESWVEEQGYLPGVIEGKSNTDLNTITTHGIYYVSGTVANQHLPIGTNGVLIVIEAPTGWVDQIFRRYGTLGTNDHQMFVRRSNAAKTEWSDWVQILTSKQLSTNGGTIATTSYIDSALAPVEVTLTDAGFVDFTTLKAWRTGNVVNAYLYFKNAATAPTAWTTIATGLPAPMMQLKTVASTWSSSYARPVALSVETDGSIKAIYGKASTTYGITFSYVTSESA